MKTKPILVGMAILWGISVETSVHRIYAQIPRFTNTRRNPKQDHLFLYKIFSMPTENPDTVRFIFYAKIANDLLQFVLKDSLYSAQYELTVVIRNTQGESIAGRIKKRTVSTKNFAMTNARDQFTEEKWNFDLSPGEYNLVIELLDKETKHPLRKKEKIVLPNFFSKPFTATDLLFFHAPKGDSLSQKEIFPVFPPVRSLSDDSLWVKFFICSDGSPRRLHLRQTFLKDDTQPTLVDSFSLTLTSKIQPIALNLNQELAFGQYTLVIQIIEEKNKMELKSPFYVRWGSHSTFLPNLEQAAEVLYYIMDRDQWNQLKKLPREEKEKALEKFWKERDPDPSTENNELEEEYYRRVEFANQNFSPWRKSVDGWRTDRGRIYIIYGPPPDVERPTTSTGEPGNYEIWYYRNLQKRFVFLIGSDFGDYRLISEE